MANGKNGNGNGRKRNGKAKPESPNLIGADPDPRNVKGQFVSGHPPTPGCGRPKGSTEGIASLRRLIGETAQEMVDSGELRAYFMELRKSGSEGIREMLRDIFMEFLKKSEASTGLDLRIELGIGPPRTSQPPGYDDPRTINTGKIQD